MQQARNRLGQAALGVDPLLPEAVGEDVFLLRLVQRRQRLAVRLERLGTGEIHAAQGRRLAMGVALEHRPQEHLQVAPQPVELLRQGIEVGAQLPGQCAHLHDRLG